MKLLLVMPAEFTFAGGLVKGSLEILEDEALRRVVRINVPLLGKAGMVLDEKSRGKMVEALGGSLSQGTAALTIGDITL